MDEGHSSSIREFSRKGNAISVSGKLSRQALGGNAEGM